MYQNAAREQGGLMPRWLDSIFLWQLDTEIQPNMFNRTPHPWTLKVNIVDSHWKLAWFCYTKICAWMLRINYNKCLQILGDFINVVLFILKSFLHLQFDCYEYGEKRRNLKFMGIFGYILRRHFWKVHSQTHQTHLGTISNCHWIPWVLHFLYIWDNSE